ncbi:Phosphatidylserine synthase [Entamoeba marina]
MTTDQTKKGKNIIYLLPEEEEEIGLNEELRLVTEKPDISPYSEWIKGPHSVIFLFFVLFLVIVAYVTGYLTAPPSNLVPFIFVGTVLVIWCIFFMPEPNFTRPHPMFWKGIQGIGLCYLLLISFLLFQDVDDVRQWLRNVDPSLGVPLPEREYAVDCRLYTPELPCKYQNFKDVLLDEFFIFHLLGWWFRTVLCRDWKLAIANSIIFELMELSFQHILPNFRECWWDHIILDLLGANALGIYLGYKTLDFFELKYFNFAGVQPVQKQKGKFVRVLGQFTPKSWTRYHWGMFTHWKRFIYVWIIIIYFQLLDLNSFFLKSELWLKPTHYFNYIRVFILVFEAALTFRQCYQYIIDKETKDIGSCTWIMGLTLLLESILCFKWGYPEYKDIPTPPLVKWSWIITASVIVIVATIFFTYKEVHYYFVRTSSPKPQKTKKNE